MSPFDPELQGLAWALIHFLWQGLLIWAITALSLRLARSSSPQLRYFIGILGLVLCMAVPIVTFQRERPQALQRASHQVSGIPAVPHVKSAPAEATPVRQVSETFGRLVEAVKDSAQSLLPWVIRAWFLGSLILGLKLGGGWVGLQLLRRRARKAPGDWQQRMTRMSRALGLWRLPDFLLSDSIQSPLAVGWVRPLLLMPAGLLSGLDPTAVEALLAHELAHIRRHDYFVNFIQCVVEILLFYHPAVWWISRRVRTERELCCDDVAVAWCNDPQIYAETLNRLHELRSRSLSPALAAGGGDLMFRIKRLLVPMPVTGEPRRLNLAALACSMGLLFSAGLSTRLLKAEAPNAPAQEKWFLAGSNRKDFKLGTDSIVTHSGKPTQTLSSTKKSPEGFGTMMQDSKPNAYLGKRVRMSAWVKTADVSKWAGLWMRVDGEGHDSLAFDNMGSRPLKGSLDWKRYEVVLDVAPEAKNIAFGLLMAGSGKVWLDDLRFEVVGSDVPTTGGAWNFPEEMNAEGWSMAGSHPGDYTASLDSGTLHEGKASHLIASKAETCQGFGTLMQMFKGSAYLGKRVRLSAWVKAENVADWAGIWMRVDGAKGSLAFDNMQQRAIKGTQDWNRVEVVLDVAENAKAIALGVLINGKGKVWMSEPTLEVVGADVPVTGR